jgi:hypothetical protein
MGLRDWFQAAKRGEFLRDYVVLTGWVLQEVDGVVRVECSMIGQSCMRECPSDTEEYGMCQRVEFTFRPNSGRLIQEGDTVRTVGNFEGMQTYVTVLGATRRLPSFVESSDVHLVNR